MGKKAAVAAKKKGIGLFAPVNLSADRVISPDAALKKVLPVAKVDMLKMAGMVSKHMSKSDLGRVRLGASATRSPARGGGDAPAMYSGRLATEAVGVEDRAEVLRRWVSA